MKRKQLGNGLVLSAMLALGLVMGNAEAVLLYSNDFDPGTALDGAGSIESAQGFDGIGAISGNIWRNTTNPPADSSVNLTGIGSHNGLLIEFDFMAIDSWDGSTTAGGSVPSDFFNVTVDTGVEFSETVDAFVESDGSITTSTDASLLTHGTNQGFTSWPDAAYQISLLVAGHTASTATVSFSAGGNGWQGGGDESWGIDNLRISAISTVAVPEPSILVLLGIGLAGIGFARNRMKA